MLYYDRIDIAKGIDANKIAIEIKRGQYLSQMVVFEWRV